MNRNIEKYFMETGLLSRGLTAQVQQKACTPRHESRLNFLVARLFAL
jgi:hypothetical protein